MAVILLTLSWYNVVIAYLPVGQTMQNDHSMENYRTGLSCSAVWFVIQLGSNIFLCGSKHAV